MLVFSANTYYNYLHMKTSHNRYKVDRLFIIGAGASNCASTHDNKAPLDKEFCQEILSLNMLRPSWVSASKQIVCGKWAYPTQFQNMGLEEAVLRQMSHFEFLDAIHPKRRPTSISGPEYLNHVAHLITFILRRSKETSANLYSKFVNKVFTANRISEINDRIITFNYDDLLDKHLISRFPLQQLYFDRMSPYRSYRHRRVKRFEYPLLIKLHGSVNWRCETKDFTRIIDTKYRATTRDHFINIWYSQKGYNSPSDTVSPFIIPPLPTKPITEFGIFTFLWTKAYEYLHEAKQIIVCGYSLPNTDQLSYSLFSNFVNKSIEKVTIVDTDTQVLGKWKQLLDRNNIRIKEWVWESDFSDYVKNMQ